MIKKTIFILLLPFTILLGTECVIYAPFDPPTEEMVAFIDAKTKEYDSCTVVVERFAKHFLRASGHERLKWAEELFPHLEVLLEPWSSELKWGDNPVFRYPQKGVPKRTLSQSSVLYSEVLNEFTDLKNDIWHEAFSRFVKAAKHYCPQPIESMPTPSYVPFSSKLGHVDQFLSQVIQNTSLTKEEKEAFGRRGEKVLTSTLRGEKYAILHQLTPYAFVPTPVTPFKRSTLKVPHPIQEPHTLDLMTYCGDRFCPALFQEGVLEDDGVYFHLGSTQEALSYHFSKGYRDIYEVTNQAVKKLREYYLVKNPHTQKVRFLVTHLNGEDELCHIALQLGQVAKLNTIQVLDHNHPLFEAPFESFTSDDLLVIGFKNGIGRKLLGWENRTFTHYGLHIDCFQHPETKKRIYLSKCVYGDQLLALLDYFYSRGMRQFTYFGTCGSLSTKYPVGTAVAPTHFQDNSLLKLNNLAKETIHNQPIHGWIQSPVLETVQQLKQMQSHRIETLDVEAKYLASFFEHRPDAKVQLVLFVSDEPFGSYTLDHFNSLDHLVDAAFERHVYELLPFLTPQQK